MQSVTSSLPRGEEEFPGHGAQDNPSVTLRYDPAAQSEHKPLTDPDLPNAHAVHTDPESALAGHKKHADPSVTLRYFPISQEVHCPDPLTGLYDPTAHALHADPSEPSCPMSQMHPE
eukprot:3939728-Rhodomonas_salina.2